MSDYEDALASMIKGLVPDSETQLSDGWFRARLGNITGSKIKELVSLTSDTPKHSADKYIAENAAEIRTGKVESIPDNQYLRRGREMEGPAMDWLSEYYGIRLYETGALAMSWSDRVCVSPDRYGVLERDTLIAGHVFDAGSKVVVESKSPKTTTHIKYMGGNKVPSEHKIQCYAEIEVTGADFLIFLSYDDRCIGAEAFVRVLMPDEKFHDRIKKVCLGSLDKMNKLEEGCKINGININEVIPPLFD